MSKQNAVHVEVKAKPRDRDVATAKVAGRTIKTAEKGDTPLGDVFFYSIKWEWKWNAKEFQRLAAQHGLEKWLPRQITETSAFKRATELLKEDKGSTAAGDDLLIRTAIFVREAPGHHRLRHIVKETRRGREKPEHKHLGSIEYLTGKEVTNGQGPLIFTRDPAVVDGAEVAMFEDMKRRVKEVMRDCLENYTDRDLRNMVDRAVEAMCCIGVRNGGAIYFCPVEERATLKRVHDFLAAVGCEIWVLPVTDAIVTPDQVGQKIVDGVNERCEVLLRQVVEYSKQPDGITSGRYEAALKELQYCTKMVTKYQDLLDLELQAAVLKVQATELKLGEAKKLMRLKTAPVPKGG